MTRSNQSQGNPEFHRNPMAIIEPELQVGTLVDELRKDCIIIQDHTGTETPSAIGAEQTIRRAAIPGQALAILQYAAVPQFYP